MVENNSEYKVLETNYSESDLAKIKEYNQSHINVAKELLYKNKEMILNNKDYANLNIQDRIKKMQNEEEFKIFCRTYPIVSKYIIAFGLFSTKAFIKYLNWKSTVRPSDSYRNELIQNQRKQEIWKNKYIYGMYIKYLYQAKNSHANINEINRAYDETVNLLNEETNSFFDKYESELSKIEETKKEYSEERKNRIKEQLKIKLEKHTINS
jgi:hypothetical protein